MFKLKEFSNPTEKRAAAETVKSELLKMKEKISVIREFEVGINFNPGLFAFDLALNSAFENHADLEIYQLHPEHQAFILFNKEYSVQKSIIDYLIP
jgi:hypothetical protein